MKSSKKKIVITLFVIFAILSCMLTYSRRLRPRTTTLSTSEQKQDTKVIPFVGDVSLKGKIPIFSMEQDTKVLPFGGDVSLERKRRMEEICRSKFGVEHTDNGASATMWKDPRTRPLLAYSENYELLVCAVPKCGSMEWIQTVLIMENFLKFNTTREIRDAKAVASNYDLASRKRFLWNVFKPDKYANDLKKTDHMLNKYYKVMTVREPLQRLVSAYKNKLEHGEIPRYNRLSRRIHKEYGNESEGLLASFSEFIDSIIHTKNPLTLDVHWRPYTYLCDPCGLQYDYIAKMETIHEDLNYISKKVGFNRNILFPGTKKDDLQQKWKMYVRFFKQLTPEKRKAIFEVYKTQYDIFGYPYPNLLFEN